MKAVRILIAMSLLALAAVPSWAAQPDPQDHEAHHPADAASAPKAKTPAPKATAPKAPASRPAARPSAATQQKLGQMDGQMKMMADMHQKMMGARTPGERGAMMGEHMKVMQDGMSMMNMMGGSGMGMGGMGGAAREGAPAGQGMPGSMEDRVQMMEKRMDMMQIMMQMMMDTQPAPAAP